MKNNKNSGSGNEDLKKSDEGILSRAKGFLSKKLQGAKNLFGNKNADEAKNALNELKNVAKEQYSKLDVNNSKGIPEQVKAVWKELQAALKKINEMCGDDVDADENGKGRAYAKAVLDGEIKDVIENFNCEYIGNFNKFEDQVIRLQQIANKTSRTSAIPLVIQDAAKETSRFYAYAYAYACSKPISERFEEIKGKLQKEKTLWNRIKKFITKPEGEFIGQLEVDSNKVAREIYKKAKTAKIRSSIKTKGSMTYFKDSIKDLFGMYTDKKVTETLSDKEQERIILSLKGGKKSEGLSNELNSNINNEFEKVENIIVNITESKKYE